MTVKIHCGDDSFIIEGDTIEDIIEITNYEIKKRNWPSIQCWSERV